MQRRNLLVTSGSFGLLAWVVACSPSGTSVPDQLTNALNVGSKIDAALVKITNDIAAPPISLLGSSAQSATLAGLALAEKGIDAFLGNTLPPPGASTLDQINGWFTVALNTAAPVLMIALPAATPVILALEAVDALLPIFEAAIPPTTAAALPAALLAPARQKVHAARVASGMTADKALAVLNNYLGKK